MERKLTPQDRAIFITQEAAEPVGFAFSWIGTRVPERLTIADPADTKGKKTLVDEEVGYMRDGMILSRAGRMLGSYERTVDYREQADGTKFNEIIFHPLDQKAFGAMLFDRLRH
jgi:hypothetical protein